MKKHVIGLIVAAMLMAMLGCIGGGTDTATPAPPPTQQETQAPPTREPTAEPTAAPTQNAGGVGFTLTVNNRSHYDICYVYISSSDSDTWGQDWLDSDIIASGDRYTFDVPAGTYDIMMTDCADTPIETAWEISDDLTLDIGGPGFVAVTVTNDLSDVNICYIYISPSSSDSWGSDLLGDKEVMPPDWSRIFFVAPDTYDFMAMDCDQNTLAEQRGVEVREDLTWYASEAGGGGGGATGPAEGQVTLTVENNSSETVCWLYVSPSSSDTWGDDRLGSEILSSGDTFDVYVDPGTYDLKAEFCSDVDPLQETDVDLTSDTVWTLSD